LIINVEVTALQEKEFYERTAINALHAKRRQLPKDNPAIIFCVVPERWEKSAINLNVWSANVAHEFFLSGSRRINRLIFYLERHFDSEDQTKGGFIIIAKSYDNPNPYYPSNFDHIFAARGRSEAETQLITEAMRKPEAMPHLTKIFRTGEFYEWVDSYHDE
jgi:hypothetical protein